MQYVTVHHRTAQKGTIRHNTAQYGIIRHNRAQYAAFSRGKTTQAAPYAGGSREDGGQVVSDGVFSKVSFKEHYRKYAPRNSLVPNIAGDRCDIRFATSQSVPLC